MIFVNNFSASFYYTLLRESPSIITFLQPDFTIQFHSPSYFAFTEHPSEATIGENFLQHLHPLDIQPLVALLVAAKADPTSKPRLQLRLRKADGSYFVVNTTITCLTSHNLVEGYIFYSQQVLAQASEEPEGATKVASKDQPSTKDQTDEEQAEQSFAVLAAKPDHSKEPRLASGIETYYQELQLYKDALDKSVLVAFLDSAGKIVQANELLCQRSRYQPEDLLGKDFRVLFSSDHHSESFFSLLWETLSRGVEWRGEVCNKTKEGRQYWVEAMLQPLADGEKPHYLFFGYEVTDRKMIEDKIRQSESRLREAQAVAHIGNWEYDVETQQMSWSDEVFNIYGLVPGKGVPSLTELMNYHHPEDWRLIQEANERVREQRETQNIDVRIIRPDNTVRYINLIGKPLLSNQGEVMKLHGTVMDIDERKLAEKSLQLHNDELQRINKQLDRFVYSATHDLRAPLMSMKGLVNLAQIDSEPGQQEKYLQMMVRSIEKLDNIIRDIIDISRNKRMDVESEKVNFELLIRESREGLSHLPGSEDINVSIQVKESAPFYSDVKRLRVMFNNLLSNAYRYSDPAKDNRFVKAEVEVSTQEAVIRLSDNGIGIGQEHQNRIFEMFYRATESQDGTGLGLYLVKEIVDILGGTIKLQSKPKKGTTFTITLPNRKPE